MIKILKNDVILEPWKHKIIDNFFEITDFEKISLAANKLHKKYEGQLITADTCLSLAEAYDDIGEDVFNIILDTNKEILENIENIVKPFSARMYTEYVSLPSFHILPPNSGWQLVHDEALDKTISIVVYLWPDNSVGTAMYKNSSRESLVKEITWKTNTAMLFCGESNVTWHDFGSRENPRVTLNFFIRTFKSQHEDENNFVWTFGNGLKTLLPKHTLGLVKEKVFRKL